MNSHEADVAAATSEAMRILNERGWCKGQNIGPNGEVCLYFSLELAVDRDSVDPLVMQVGQWLPRMYKRRSYTWFGAVMLYNDVPWRRKRQVMRLLEKVCKAAEEGRLRVR